MTTLQQQLSSIRAQSTQELNLKAQKVAHGKSLVFPPTEAASQSFFDIYQFCLRGFQQLCKLDVRFVPFADSLFSEQSMDIERAHMSKDANTKLDKTLESFMGLIGPSLQLRDAQCAVEWLIRRFRVHEYNTQFLILTFLPYHDTNTFAVVLQLVPESKLPPVFGFMRNYISARTNFKRPILVREATRRPQLLGAINQYILRVSRENQQAENLVAFWTDVSIQAVNGQLDQTRSGRQSVQKDRQDEVILGITSFLHDALQIRNASDLILGCYALVTLVASKAMLNDQWMDSLMVAVANTFASADSEACLMCLAVLAEQRSSKRKKLPNQLVICVTQDLSSLLDLLSSVATQISTNRLTFGICLTMLDPRPTNQTLSTLDFVANAVQRALLTKSKTKALIARAVQQVAKPTSNENSNHKTALVALIQSWAKLPEYSASFQRALASSNTPHTDLPDVLVAELGYEHSGLGRQDTAATMETVSEDIADDSTFDLEDLPIPDDTCFTQTPPHSFEALVKGLATLASQRRDELKIRDYRPFKQMNEQMLTSFLIRAWSSPASPLAARQAALRATKQVLGASARFEWHPVILVPFLLCALGDTERRVRQVAAECILMVQAACRDDLNVSKEPELHGELGIDAVGLPLLDMKTFLKALSLHLEACVLDANQVAYTVNRLLAGHSDQLHSQSGKETKELKSTVRTSIELFLATCARHSNLLPVQLRLFSMLSRSGKIASSARIKCVYPTLQRWFEQDTTTSRSRAVVEGLSLIAVNEQFLGLLSHKESESARILQHLVEVSADGSHEDLDETVFPAASSLYRKNEAPTHLVQAILRIALDEDLASVPLKCRTEARDAFLSILLSTSALGELLSALSHDEHLPDQPTPAKRRRTSKSGTGRPSLSQVDLNRKLNKQTLILEKVEASNSKSPELLGGLFHVLGEVLYLESTTHAKLDYLVQLALRSLNTIVDHLILAGPSQNDKKHQNSIRMDTLVECLRNKSGRSTQNDILLLVSKLATWNPELVLHSVMPIFTFMGKNTVRQGDDYTAHVIARTIETVVPPLALSLRKNNRSVITALSEVLQSFTAAYEHIPSHRRLPLFALLIKELGPEDSLFAVIAMLVHRRPADSSVTVFLGDLMALFDTRTELVTLKRCFDVLLDAQAPHAFAARRTFSEAVLNPREMTSEQFETTVSAFLMTLSQLLRRPDFRKRVAKLFKHPQNADFDPKQSPESVYPQLLTQSINLSQVVHEKQPSSQDDAKQTLSDVMKVLPVAEMLPSITSILGSASDNVKVLALRALEDQIQTVTQHDTRAAGALLLFIANLCDVLSSTQDIELKQATISCIDQISERFGKRDTVVVGVAAATLAGESALGHLDISLQILALLALASMVEVLREEFVPLVPRIFQQAYPILEVSAGQDRYNELRSALFAVVNAVAECLPQMLSTEDQSKAFRMCHNSAAAIPVEDDPTGRQQFYSIAARHFDAETCFTAAQQNLEHAIQTGVEACSEHLRFVLLLVQRHSKRAIREHASTIFQMITETWDIRRLSATNSVFQQMYDSKAVENVQILANDIAMSTIKKLNDDALRLHFAHLVDWAAAGQSGHRTGSQIFSATSLFGFLKVFNQTLRSLVTTYASYYLKLATDILDTTRPTTTSSIDVLRWVLDTLSFAFAADESDYWQDPQHFDTIVTPLLAQITRFAQADSASLSLHVLPTIRNLVSAAYSTDKRANVNTEVLKLMRHNDPRVRLAAVQCQRGLLAQIGEEWVTMVSQMLPFINEAQEDGDEVVERETRKWIKDLEAGLGESMAGMLQ